MACFEVKLRALDFRLKTTSLYTSTVPQEMILGQLSRECLKNKVTIDLSTAVYQNCFQASQELNRFRARVQNILASVFDTLSLSASSQ